MPQLRPLVEQHFGIHFERLAQLVENEPHYKTAHFLDYYKDSGNLEKRLQRLEPLGVIEPILAEIGNEGNAYQLNERLQDAWAELRTADQLRKEGFQDIQKVTEIADLTATKDGQNYAVQVTRTQRNLRDEIEKLNTTSEMVRRFIA